MSFCAVGEESHTEQCKLDSRVGTDVPVRLRAMNPSVTATPCHLPFTREAVHHRPYLQECFQNIPAFCKNITNTVYLSLKKWYTI